MGTCDVQTTIRVGGWARLRVSRYLLQHLKEQIYRDFCIVDRRKSTFLLWLSSLLPSAPLPARGCAGEEGVEEEEEVVVVVEEEQEVSSQVI